MNMTDLNNTPEKSQTPSGDEQRWQTVLTEFGAEIGGPLTRALERVQNLAETGQIDRSGLLALVDELQQAKRSSVSGQQLARLACGQLRQVPEQIALKNALCMALNQRTAEIEAHQLVIKPKFQPVDVICDAPLLSSLIHTMLTWCLSQAKCNIELGVGLSSWPAHGYLGCTFDWAQPDEPSTRQNQLAPLSDRLNTMDWRLLEQTAWAMNLRVERHIHKHRVRLTLEFPSAVIDRLDAVDSAEQQHAPLVSHKALTGSHVLVIASRREVRLQIRDAIKGMGWILDFVSSVDEAREFCRGGLPQAIVVESVLQGGRFHQLRREIDANGSPMVFVEIMEEGHEFEMSAGGGHSMARVGRGAIAASLSGALVFELSRVSA